MAIFIDGEHNCACARQVCDWACITYAKLMSDNMPNTAVGYVPPTKKTNADRIRAMSDEELASFLAIEYWRLPKCNSVNLNGECVQPDCTGCWLDWLKKEVKE